MKVVELYCSVFFWSAKLHPNLGYDLPIVYFGEQPQEIDQQALRNSWSANKHQDDISGL
jgi:hypothetical protein